MLRIPQASWRSVNDPFLPLINKLADSFSEGAMLPNTDLYRFLFRTFAAAAAMLLLVTLNLNTAFAQSAGNGEDLEMALQHAPVGGGEVEYQIGGGRGDPIIFIHGAFVADTFRPLMDQPSLSGYRLINYHRRGYGGSSPAEDSPQTYVPRASADIAELLTHLDAKNVHVVAHSSGAVIALQLACDQPELLKSLVLIEPPLLTVPSAEDHGQKVGLAASRYGGGDVAGAVDNFMQIVGGPTWRDSLEAEIPGGAEQAIRHAATFFEYELPGVRAWQCDVEGSSISAPVLFVQGDRTPQFHAEAGRVIQEWFPQTESRVIENASHMVMVDNPDDTAERIAEFVGQVD